MPRSVTLGGVPLMADRAVVWAGSTGVAPYQAEFHVTPADAAELLRKRGPLQLVVTETDGGTQTWENLWALRERPDDNPFGARVLVADWRWCLPYCHIVRRYNMRRQTGYFRTTANDVAALDQVSPTFAYARYSVQDDGTPWTPEKVLDDVLGEVALACIRAGVPVPRIVIEQTAFPTSIEDLELDDPVDVALGRALEKMPGTICRADPNSFTIYSKLAGGESQTVNDIGYEAEGGGHIITVSHSNEAPKEIDVVFGVQAEVRFDYDARAPADVWREPSMGAEEADPDEIRRRLVMVLPVPDWAATVGGQLLAQGTWCEWQRYVDDLPDLPGGGRLTTDRILIGRAPGSGLLGRIKALAPLDPGTDDTQAEIDAQLAAGRGVWIGDWLSRMVALSQSLYTTFRFPRAWHDSVVAWLPTRLATVNPSTGERASAQAYSDYCLLISEKGWNDTWANGEEERLAMNVDRWRATLDSTSRAAPATMTLDAQQGVFHLSYKPDPNSYYESCLPAALDNPPSATQIEHGATLPLTYNTIRTGGVPPGLSATHRLSVILTAQPAGREGATFRRRVTAKDLGSGDSDGRLRRMLANARGPVKDIRIPDSLEVARVQWLDAKAEETERLFGMRGGTPDLTDMIINRGPEAAAGKGGQTPGASIDEIALAVARAEWSSWIDHPSGSATGRMNFAARPRGWCEAVLHVVSPEGDATTGARFPDRLAPFDFMPLVPPSVRAILQRLVYQGAR